ncbi:MAG TPA: rubredoxin [Thermodesulfobacteriota bacterium]
MKKWKCVECGYIHEGDYPPDACPVCYVPSEAFKEVVVNA